MLGLGLGLGMLKMMVPLVHWNGWRCATARVRVRVRVRDSEHDGPIGSLEWVEVCSLSVY